MIALDTNFLVRLIAGDERAQERAVLRLLADRTTNFFIGDVTLAELVWVLEGIYEFNREELVCALEALLNRADLVFEDAIRVRRAARHFAGGGDFADALILGRAQAEGCAALVSFDKSLKNTLPRFRRRSLVTDAIDRRGTMDPQVQGHRSRWWFPRPMLGQPALRQPPTR